RAYDLDGVAPFACVGAGLGVLHAAHIIGVGNANIANAAQNVARDIAVAACWLTAQIVLDVAQPVFGCLDAVMRDHGRDQRGIVGVLTRAYANLAFPFGIGKGFVGNGADVQILGHIGHAVAQRQGEPLIVLAAQV